MEQGLQDRPSSNTRTADQRLAVAGRILDAYRSASEEYAHQRSVYKVSNEWIPIYNKPLRPLLDVLKRGDARGLRDLLDEFFRSPISTGLCGLPVNMAEDVFRRRPGWYLRKLYLIDHVYRWRLLQSLVPEVQPQDLFMEDFGNPYGIFVSDQFVRSGADYTYYYARQVVRQLAQCSHRPVVMELGGGVGQFAYFLRRIHQGDLTYINLDLPEILCIFSYQLLNLYPEQRVLLYGEAKEINSSLIVNYDMALLPSFLIESLAEDSVDVTFNSYSLAEMSSDAVTNYTRQIGRVTRQAILHVNHVSQALVGGDRFDFDSSKFVLSNRERALWNLGKNLKCDEYEFLLERKPEDAVR